MTSCSECNLSIVTWGAKTKAVHERGCPNAGKLYVDGAWRHFVDCFECGYPVEVGTACSCGDPPELEEEVAPCGDSTT